MQITLFKHPLNKFKITANIPGTQKISLWEMNEFWSPHHLAQMKSAQSYWQPPPSKKDLTSEVKKVFLNNRSAISCGLFAERERVSEVSGVTGSGTRPADRPQVHVELPGTRK